jgi:hypothetical protein
VVSRSRCLTSEDQVLAQRRGRNYDSSHASETPAKVAPAVDDLRREACEAHGVSECAHLVVLGCACGPVHMRNTDTVSA